MKIDKYKEVFLSEAKEHIASMEKALLKLERNPARLEPANDIFRAAHTLKSMAAAMNYDRTAELCHTLEDVLDLVRKRKIEAGQAADVLFESVDLLKLTVAELGKNRKEPDTASLVDKLRSLSALHASLSAIAPQGAEAEPATEIEKIRSIEVKVERLDRLMNLAEELLINKMALDGIKERLLDPEFTAAVDALGRLVADIQYNVMQARLVPIGFIFNRFPRMVRDLARKQDKVVNLETRGSDIELDRVMIDEIGESLVHLLRNSIDHGIETPEERKKTGKPREAVIRLTATRTKNSAAIEVMDDGGGLDFERIKQTALKRGLISPQASREEVLNSIFSGVSTAGKVTPISGRGFGLDIVKKKVESLGGSITVESAFKKGTTFLIEVPLTLAIIKTLFVEVEGKAYAIPLVNVERLVTVRPEDIKGMLNYEAIVLDEEDIPVTRLNVLFNSIATDSPALMPDSETGRQPIAIVRKGEERLGLAIDAFLGTAEIVIKPLNRLLRENKYFAGSTIVGSGEVVLILDVSNLTLSRREYAQIKRE